mmetsp:Transcript_13254/g.16832  ORF Transcript_13254/g.16832 Transcript_13254/m.16832 type:complete len:108 (+) Transcript_13254:40-363(+)|eukprot:CAMPEP_0170467278 /NCGR_PEP_ID=MMETSP0123-20130129/10913_1 /TAXON_ID=182087 /ORGANISM="Favella ehrenbergii, Strain Fehren 1" /LENGTH=107 /DNA_ID=CAMNT_0010733597 /DNA_START=27 /DNA_END=350 /DNA_ORIENTATION=-
MVDVHQATPSNRMNASLPVIALVGIFDRQNEPIVLQNYLAKHLASETSNRLAFAEKTLEGADEAIQKVQKATRQEMDAIDMQMAMLAYSTLDIFTEKSQIVPDRVKT